MSNIIEKNLFVHLNNDDLKPLQSFANTSVIQSPPHLKTLGKGRGKF